MVNNITKSFTYSIVFYLGFDRELFNCWDEVRPVSVLFCCSLNCTKLAGSERGTHTLRMAAIRLCECYRDAHMCDVMQTSFGDILRAILIARRYGGLLMLSKMCRLFQFYSPEYMHSRDISYLFSILLQIIHS